MQQAHEIYVFGGTHSVIAGKICQQKADRNELDPHATVDPRWKKPPVKLYCFQQEADELAADLRVLGEEDNRKMIEVLMTNL